MNKKRISIGEMAKMNHITIPTLRLYDEIGILKPIYIDEKSGYRYYDIKQTGRLDLILTLKSMGISLKEIKCIFDQRSVDLIFDFLKEKENEIENQILDLANQKEAVKRTIISLDRYKNAPPSGTFSLEYIPERKICSIEASVNFYESDINAYEKILSELRSSLSNYHLNYLRCYNVGTSVKCNDYLKNDLIANKIFIFTDSSFPKELNTDTLTSGMYACVYIDSYEEELNYAKKLREFCRQQNYIPCGDYICEIVTEFTLYDPNRRNMFLRLQIPVKFQSDS